MNDRQTRLDRGHVRFGWPGGIPRSHRGRHTDLRSTAADQTTQAALAFALIMNGMSGVRIERKMPVILTSAAASGLAIRHRAFGDRAFRD